MKTVFIFISLLIPMLLLGCGESAKEMTLKLDSSSYIGFSNLPSNYTPEQAEKNGCLVQVQLESVSGEEKWDSFVNQAAKGVNTSIRIAIL